MGIRKTELEFILECQAKGVELGKTVTLGRQDLLTNYDDISLCLNKYDIEHNYSDIKSFYEAQQQFVEPLLEFIGAKNVQSMDQSTFEGATIQHDLNNPIPETLKNTFDTVIDSGTTEHVFNLPQAMKNCMDLLKIGGHLISILPANNYCGHGFYQVSPELLFRIFSKENNFEVKIMIFCIHSDGDEWYEMFDPKLTGTRVEPQSNHPSSILMVAHKISDQEVYSSTPQQSDYANEWENITEKGETLDRLHFWRGNKEPISLSASQKFKQKFKRKTKMVLDRSLNIFGLCRKNNIPDNSSFNLYNRR